jgi:hypothetical protein
MAPNLRASTGSLASYYRNGSSLETLERERG